MRIAVYVLMLWMAGCLGIGGSLSFHPAGTPLKVSANTWGEISFTLEGEVVFPTLLGTVGVGVIADPARYFEVANTLTVQVDGQDHIFDLGGIDFNVQFEPGYYAQVNLIKKGENIILVLARVQGGNGETTGDPGSGSPGIAAGCSEVVPPNLAVGGEARVMVFQVRVRSAPHRNAGQVNYYSRNRELAVVNGPVCADGWWWRKLFSTELGYGGWVAQGDEENYYLIP